MSQDEIIKVANQDTPRGVNIPNSANGVVLWLVGKFGAGAIFAAAAFHLYQDMRADREELFHAYRQNIEVIADFKSVLEQQTREIGELRAQRP